MPDIDYGQVLEALNDKTDRDMSNIDQAGKNVVTTFITPEYTHSVSLVWNTECTIAADGAVAGKFSAANGGKCQLIINSVIIEELSSESGQRCISCFYALVKKGDVVQFKTSGQTDNDFTPTFYYATAVPS